MVGSFFYEEKMVTSVVGSILLESAKEGIEGATDSGDGIEIE